jgi:glycosyltransferase involved in cell wall biosynthesis
MPKVSIITPTKDRQNLLPALWECVSKQSFNDIEWLIHDSSQQPAPPFAQDARVKYIHAHQPMSIGAKRNALCKIAQGEIIVHFDDDDFYSSHYIRDMVTLMTDQKADFVKLFGFFLYHKLSDVLAYWDLDKAFPQHFRLQPNTAPAPEKYDLHMTGLWGYGFSYVFRRTVWEANKFPEINGFEDLPFAEKARDNFKTAGKCDFNYTCLHVIHTNNSSIAFPQQLLPPGSRSHLFPDFRND